MRRVIHLSAASGVHELQPNDPGNTLATGRLACTADGIEQSNLKSPLHASGPKMDGEIDHVVVLCIVVQSWRTRHVKRETQIAPW